MEEYYNDPSCFDDSFNEYEKEKWETEKEIEKATLFTLSEIELQSYKESISDCVPAYLKMSDKQIIRMKYWEEKKFRVRINALIQLDKLFGNTGTPIDISTETANWRREYIETLIKDYNHMLKISQEATIIEKTISRIERRYGIERDTNIIVKEESTRNKADTALINFFLKSY